MVQEIEGCARWLERRHANGPRRRTLRDAIFLLCLLFSVPSPDKKRSIDSATLYCNGDEWTSVYTPKVRNSGLHENSTYTVRIKNEAYTRRTGVVILYSVYSN